MRERGEEKFRVDCIQVLRDKLPLIMLQAKCIYRLNAFSLGQTRLACKRIWPATITLHTDWLVGFHQTMASFFSMNNRNICVDYYFDVNSFLIGMNTFMDKYFPPDKLKIFYI